ncbi:MAG: MBL fold metallo-hydrolase [Nitrospirae bacterium]|nr:MBL fold metallo-hydrolase [Nitrospirota bacterium]
MRSTISSLFQIRTGEGRSTLLLVVVMLLLTMGGSIGSPGINALFFTRVGVEFLPYMYIALAGLTVLTTLAFATLLLGCSNETAAEKPSEAAGPISSENYRGKPATGHTVRANAALEKRLPKGDFLDGSMMTDFNEGTLVAPLPPVMGTNDMRKFEYLKGERPDSFNPSLFHASRVAIEDVGLYRVAEGFYQIRGDIAHITAMRGETGWIILDPGTTKEFTEQAWAFAVQHLPGGAAVPIVAVFYSHSHIDHWAAFAVWSPGRMWIREGSRSLLPTVSWTRRLPKTSSPATPCHVEANTNLESPSQCWTMVPGLQPWGERCR